MGWCMNVASRRESTPAERWAEAHDLFLKRRLRGRHWDRPRWVGKQARRFRRLLRVAVTRYKGRHDRWTA